jgi:hypothetical protein
MPIDHLANANNGNAVKKVATTTTIYSGRTSKLPIYTVGLSGLGKVVGDILQKVISSMKPDDEKDLMQGYRQPTDHDNRDGNLPVAPGNGVAYREYYVPGNTLPKPAYLRLVADMQNRRLYITPTHYDVWVQDRKVAENLSAGAAVAPTTTGAQNPFFLLDAKA